MGVQPLSESDRSTSLLLSSDGYYFGRGANSATGLEGRVLIEAMRKTLGVAIADSRILSQPTIVYTS